jgi:hypothetical protein
MTYGSLMKMTELRFMKYLLLHRTFVVVSAGSWSPDVFVYIPKFSREINL